MLVLAKLLEHLDGQFVHYEHVGTHALILLQQLGYFWSEDRLEGWSDVSVYLSCTRGVSLDVVEVNVIVLEQG